MSSVAIIGAGAIGSAVAHRLLECACVNKIQLLDAEGGVASGKALDLRQTTPVVGVDVAVTGSDDLLSASGAAAIVIADRVNGGEWQGEEALALIGRLVRAGSAAPLVFAGGAQTPLLEASHVELRVPADRLLGTATSGLVSAVKAVVGADIGRGGVELTIGGRPPALVVGWSSASVEGTALSEFLPPHRTLAISNSLRKLWPPGPQTIGAATAVIVDALINGSRRLHVATTILDGEFGVRRVAGALPVELGRGRVLRRVVPAFSPQERTEVVNSLNRA